ISVTPDWPEYVLPDSYLDEPDGFLGTDAVIVGKDGYLYEPWYINEYMGYDYVYVYTDDDELMRRVMVLKFIQEELEKRGVAFCVAISASKASAMPQFIPDFYMDARYTLDDDYVRPYVRFVKMLAEKGVYHIDSQALYKTIGLTNSFAKTGTHWNKLASFETTRAVMAEIDRQTGRNIEKLVFDEIVAKKTPAPFYPNEQDIFNIGYSGNRQEMRDAIVDDFYYWPDVYLEYDGNGSDRLGHTIIQGGSFSHDFVHYFRDKKIAKSVTAYYYNNDGKVDVDWAKEIGKAEFVLFEVNEQHVYNMGGGVPGDSSTNIIDSLYFWLAGNPAN
ncbi:MAG: hypothetical protein FWD23_16615, partial [Oscillospiraceae bacterium]|nr:hypothetical protein [Oscillospiraceae bacterium]